jgi:hypothetical protein
VEWSGAGQWYTKRGQDGEVNIQRAGRSGAVAAGLASCRWHLMTASLPQGQVRGKGSSLYEYKTEKMRLQDMGVAAPDGRQLGGYGSRRKGTPNGEWE